MSTTIQVEKETLELLKRLKEHLNASTYNEVIGKLAEKSFGLKSMRGYLGKSSRKDILKDLRDKHDRF